MSKALSFIVGAGIGAAGMYYFDPQMGRTRRALAQEKLFHYAREIGVVWSDVAQEVAHRAYGTVMGLRYQLDRAVPSDRVLEARVKSKLGRVVSHAGAIDVTAADGVVTLSGPILADEVDRALLAIRMVPGVTGIVSRLDVHRAPDGIPGLQTGQSVRSGAQG